MALACVHGGEYKGNSIAQRDQLVNCSSCSFYTSLFDNLDIISYTSSATRTTQHVLALYGPVMQLLSHSERSLQVPQFEEIQHQKQINGKTDTLNL